MKSLTKFINEAYHNLMIDDKHVQKIKKEGGTYLGQGRYTGKGEYEPKFISHTGKRSLSTSDHKDLNAAQANTKKEYVADMHSHLSNNAEDPKNEAEKDALGQYTHDSTFINKYLHQKHNEEVDTDDHTNNALNENTIAHLDRFLGRSKTLKPMAVYSGLSRDPSKSFDTTHKTVHIPRYLSTSVDSRKALGFSRSIADPTDGMKHSFHLLKVNVPKGTAGAYIDHLSEHENEHEFLMPRNTHVKLRGKYRDAQNPDVVIWEADYLHSTAPKRKVKEKTQTALDKTGTRSAKYDDMRMDESKFDMDGWKNLDAEGEYVAKNEDIGQRMPNLNGYSHHIRTYTVHSYKINKPLYDGVKLEGKKAELAKGLSEMIGKSKLPEPLTVFSGISFDPEEKQQAMSSGKIHLPAYTSTSIQPNRAEKFAENQYLRKMDMPALHVLKIDLPRGHGAAFIGGHSNFPSEREVLLDKGLTLTVKRKTVHNVRSEGISAKCHVWHCVPSKAKS